MKAGDWVRNRFQIERLAGSGAMGAVYLARDAQTNGKVALKMLHGHRLEHAARFEREGHALANLSHPAIVQYVAHGTDDAGDPFLAMEWIEGEALSERLSRGRLSVAEAMTLGHRISDALSMVHRSGVVHRDLKPSNVMLAGGSIERAILVDFGIAHLADRTRLTGTGAMLGTVGFMPPEQARGETGLDPRADVYAIGAMLFRGLSGQMPFHGNEPLVVLMAQMSQEAPRLSAGLQGVPPALDDLVARMLARMPQSRPQDGAHVAYELSRIDISHSPNAPLPQHLSGGQALPTYGVSAPTVAGQGDAASYHAAPPSTLGAAAHTVPGAQGTGAQEGNDGSRSKLILGLVAAFTVLGLGVVITVGWVVKSVASTASAGGADCPADTCKPFPVDDAAAVEPTAVYPRIKAMVHDLDPTAQLVTFGTDSSLRDGKVDLSQTKLHFSYRTSGGRGLVASVVSRGGQTTLRWTFQGEGSALGTVPPVGDPKCTLQKVWALLKGDFDTGATTVSYLAYPQNGEAMWLLRDPKMPTRMSTFEDARCPE